MRGILGSFGFLCLLTLGVAQSFTYQGMLKQNGVPVNGAYDFRFRLWTAATGGAQVGSDVLVNDLNVQSGLFTTELNFGSVWDGSDRFLEIAVRPGAQTGSYQALSPRVKITRTPYAARADAAPPIGSAGGDLSGAYPNPTVARLQGRAVSTMAPSAGQVLKWNGSDWMPANDLRDQFWLSSGSNIYYWGGKASIGTNTIFSHALNVRSSDADALRLIGPNPPIGWGARLNFGDSNYVYLQEDEDDKLTIYASRRVALMGGNVGIGLTAPTARLHVSADSGSDAVLINHTGNGRGLQVQVNSDTAIWGVTQMGFAGVDGRGPIGVYGRSDSGEVSMGVCGIATSTIGETYGVYGQSNHSLGAGVFGYSTSTVGFCPGVYGETEGTSGSCGVYGKATATTGFGSGVKGITNTKHSLSYGVWGEEPALSDGHAVYALGTIGATGYKAFQIDHPLSPETHYLNHFCAEAPEPYNFYRGTVTLDARGEAWVQLPDYFDAINRDPSYHLTPIGAPMPNLHVAVEIQGNRFKIAGGVPGRKVSWRVEAIRNDLWMQRYGFKTEQEKEDDIKGKYLNPELYGQPKERGLHYRPAPAPSIKPE